MAAAPAVGAGGGGGKAARRGPPAPPVAGFKACIFDKDNTLSRPFVLSVHPSLQPSLEVCRQVFGSNLVLYSNSAGLEQYDPQGKRCSCARARARAWHLACSCTPTPPPPALSAVPACSSFLMAHAWHVAAHTHGLGARPTCRRGGCSPRGGARHPRAAAPGQEAGGRLCRAGAVVRVGCGLITCHAGAALLARAGRGVLGGSGKLVGVAARPGQPGCMAPPLTLATPARSLLLHPAQAAHWVSRPARRAAVRRLTQAMGWAGGPCAGAVRPR